MKISIGADHRGYDLKNFLQRQLPEIQWIDRGSFSGERSDYPMFARLVAQDVSDNASEFGVLICGSGVGMSIAANRFARVRAALCWSASVARVARFHDDANILVLAADFATEAKALAIIKKFLETPFRGGRYQRRLDMLDMIDSVAKE